MDFTTDSNFIRIREKVKNFDATLVAVSKTKPITDLLDMYSAGQRHFGENKVQELVGKYEALPKDIQWHMIGTLQTNKVKYIAPFIHLIHSVDNLRLLREVDKQAEKHNRIISILLQVYIASEETKHGASGDELEEMVDYVMKGKAPHLAVKGLMGMASFSEDNDLVRREFTALKVHFEELKSKGLDMDTLSMGMSEDFGIALDCGATMVRIGSLLFGRR